MTAQVIDGKNLATKFNMETSKMVNALEHTHNISPGLAVVIVGNDTASHIYVENKIKKCHDLGINSFKHHFPEDTDEKTVLDCINNLNSDPKVNGILVQLPLPSHLNKNKIIDSISHLKDVDGFTKENIHRVYNNTDGIYPCTPLAIVEILNSLKQPMVGKKAVIIGRSNIVGKPLSLMLLNRSFSVSILHSKSINLEDEVSRADVLIAAVGKPGLVKENMVKKGAIVIDVGISRVNDKLAGDVEYKEVSNKASFITPVPGGVGPMTIAMLMRNTIKATCLQHKLKMEALK